MNYIIVSEGEFIILLALIRFVLHHVHWINLPVVLCGCETWSLTSSKEHRLRVFEIRVLKRIFGLKSDKIIGRYR
jgi:hypothetical protein